MLGSGIVAESCLGSGTWISLLDRHCRTGRICGAMICQGTNHPSAAKPEAKQWKWSLVTGPKES